MKTDKCIAMCLKQTVFGRRATRVQIVVNKLCAKVVTVWDISIPSSNKDLRMFGIPTDMYMERILSR